MDGCGGEEEMEDRRELEKEEKKEKDVVLMWGYLPGVSPDRLPLLHPVPVRRPESTKKDAWRDVSGGGCGFAMAISESGKLITWGSTDDLGQSYLTSGKHEEVPEAFPLPAEADIVKAAAGWAHCVAVTGNGEVFTWGWKECVPTGKVIADHRAVGNLEDEKQCGSLNEQVSPNSGTIANYEGKSSEESTKRRKLSSVKQGHESLSSGDDALATLPCIVALGAGVKITSVAAGGRHTLSLSDVGQVWGWGYGGEGQLGLGSRIRMVSSPHLVPCIESASYGKDKASGYNKGITSSEGQIYRVTGSFVKAIACGGRHSAAVTDTGAILTFGWGLYGQLGLGDSIDRSLPSQVPIDNLRVVNVSCGWWHTLAHAQSPA
ncbi:Ultraviolet-B receptor UVR8 [Platanthera guangdongensis]|uniref:Ultraviolet-B receptor UVR8 n=1 Tax=Platanthera guangdongensis TaxID=2320717 RepID=A0ABR2LUZ4_9ASPA